MTKNGKVMSANPWFLTQKDGTNITIVTAVLTYHIKDFCSPLKRLFLRKNVRKMWVAVQKMVNWCLHSVWQERGAGSNRKENFLLQLWACPLPTCPIFWAGFPSPLENKHSNRVVFDFKLIVYEVTKLLRHLWFWILSYWFKKIYKKEIGRVFAWVKIVFVGEVKNVNEI